MSARPVAAPLPPRMFGAVNWLGIGTVMRTELQIYRRFWLMTVGGPVLSMGLYLLVFVLAIGPSRVDGAGDAVLRFMAPGMVMMTLLQWASQNVAFSVVYKKLEGIFADYMSVPIMPWELVFGFVVTSMITGTITTLPVLIMVMLVTGVSFTAPILAILVVVFSGAMMAVFGFLIGLWAKKWDGLSAVIGFIIVPLTFLSGTFVAIDRFPDWAATLMLANPIYYGVDAFRGTMGGPQDVPIWLSLLVLAASFAVLLAVTAVLVGRGWRLKS
ncbi:MAG: ABC transporter permease [Pseudomonadota bacterium]